MPRPLRAPRGDNRQSRLLDEAARLFGIRGFEGASIQDIVRAVDMLPGSLYYHFARKEDLLIAVYAEGVRRITERVESAVAARSGPWDRLEAACVAHLGALLEEGDYAQVVIRVRPDDVPAVAPGLLGTGGGEPTAAVRERVLRARAAQTGATAATGRTRSRRSTETSRTAASRI